MWRRRARRDQDFAAEIEAHLEAETDRLVADGMDPVEARVAARRRFGNVTLARERFYRLRHFMWWDTAKRDLRQALRSLRHAPWYSGTVVVVIALVMALATTVFAVVDGVLFQPLPYRSPSELFALSVGFSKLPDSTSFASLAPADVLAFKAAVPQLAFAVFTAGQLQMIGVKEGAGRADVDASFFDVIGVAPAIGGFKADDFGLSTPLQPAILTHEFWKRRFGGDPSVIGRSFVGDEGRGIRVVGVMPPDFVLPHPQGSFAPEVLTPLVVPTGPRIGRGTYLYMIARAGAGMPADEASRRLTTAAAEIARTRPPQTPPAGLPEDRRIRWAGFDTATLEPLRRVLTSRFHQTSSIAFGSAAVLLLIAVVNITGLVVARVQGQWRDLVLRRSLGARYLDVLRPLAVENAMLVLLGAGAGVWLARPLLTVTLRLLPGSALLLKEPAIDARVLVGSAFTALAAAIMVTALPARMVSRSNVRATLLDGATTTSSRRGHWALIAIQVALACIMAVGAALVGGSLLRVWSEPPGFDIDRTAVIPAGWSRGASAEAIERIVADLRRIPGIAMAGGIDSPILERTINGSDFDVPAGVVDLRDVESRAITEGYLPAAGLTPMAGRTIASAEFATGAHVVLVSESVAQKYWPGQPAVGQTLISKGAPFQVIGVVRDARYTSLDMAPRGAIYWPLAAKPQPSMLSILIAFAPGSTLTLPDATEWVRKRCPECFVGTPGMLTDKLGASIRPRTFNAWFFTSFGAASLVIVCSGILGLVAMTTSRRTKEIGIRMALGATPPALVVQILREQALAVLMGLASGGLIATWAVRFVKPYLYSTTPYDASFWSAGITAIVVAALIGGLIPSWRASRIDPVRALRVD